MRQREEHLRHGTGEAVAPH
uniref:Uncharacterized protein n=1 Tax=Arundo donax TaxID=35708 RepID=A0A0A9ABN1_ARUDO